ncbi:MAG: alkaline phosphatase family protein [Clostridia bacterium]|nr:alkaline phosphatase family protein [Clostridia bacterium]
MKNIKRFLIPLILVMSFLFTACSAETTGDNVTDTTVADTEVNVEPTKNDTPYKHVLIIGVTAAGAFFEDAYTPNMDRIFKDANITYECRSGAPTSTVSSWTTLLHGIEYNAHGLIEGVKDKAYPTDSPYPSIFRAVLEAKPDSKVVSVCRWRDINNNFIEDGIGIEKITMEKDDLFVAETACEYVNKNGAPTLMFVQLDFPDDRGHNSAAGFGGDEHLSAISRTDTLIDAVYRAYERQGVLDDTLVIVTSNHGGYLWDHGGNSDGEKNVMFAVRGKNVIKNGSAEDMDIRDIAPIVMHALGLESPEGWTGRLPEGIFEGVGGGERVEYVDTDSKRYRETLPTPTSDDEGYISNYIKDKALKYYLTFDGTAEDACGNKTEAVDDYSFVGGVYGEGIRLDNGHVTIPEYSTGGAFTISMWVKFDEIVLDSTMLTNLDSGDQKNSGFSFGLQCMGGKIGKSILSLTYGDDGVLSTKPYMLSSDYLKGWNHLIFTYNPDESCAKVYFDFGSVKTVTVNNSDGAFIGLDSLCIGDSLTGETERAFGGVIDEFMQFDGYFTDEDVEALKAYYGIEK